MRFNDVVSQVSQLNNGFDIVYFNLDSICGTSFHVCTIHPLQLLGLVVCQNSNTHAHSTNIVKPNVFKTNIANFYLRFRVGLFVYLF